MAISGVKAVAELFKAYVNTKGFERLFNKVRVVDGGNGRMICETTVDESISNRMGTLYGGYTASLVDSISTIALMTKDPTKPGASVDLSVSYISAAKIGDEIIIEANTVKLGKTLAFLTVDIKNKATGKIVATGKHTKFVGFGN